MDGEGDLLSLRDEFSGESSLSISWSVLEDVLKDEQRIYRL